MLRDVQVGENLKSMRENNAVLVCGKTEYITNPILFQLL